MIKTFKRQFVHPLCTGVKRSTIRRDSVMNLKAGQTLHAYTGARMSPTKVGNGLCSFAAPICVDAARDGVTIADMEAPAEFCRGLDAVAFMEGFDDWAAMRAFFITMHGDAPFRGWFAFWGDTFVKDEALNLSDYEVAP